MNKNKIRYELLKPLPDVKIGAIGEINDEYVEFPNVLNEVTRYYTVEKKPSWFKKISKVEDDIRDYQYVKLVSKRPTHWNKKGEMDKYLGTIQKIYHVHENGRVEFFNVDKWRFEINDIECVIEETDIVKMLNERYCK